MLQIGTKYDQFTAFTKEEQEEITRQVGSFRNRNAETRLIFPRPQVATFRSSDEGPSHLLLNESLHQRAEDLQDRALESRPGLPNAMTLRLKSASLKAFDLKCTIPEITETGEPLLIYIET
jgi:GTP-binding protein of the ras superfamily involved in termination of M-phase